MSIKTQSEITITQISDGKGGATWYSGVGMPSQSLGVEGDFYLDTFTQDIYKKDSRNWGLISNIKGQPGTPGTTPHIGSNNHWFIGEQDTGIVAEGIDGQPGTTPHIGINNHWFIGDYDTGVVAKGIDGQPGASGISVDSIQRYYTIASSKPTITAINNGVPYTNNKSWTKGEPTEEDINNLGPNDFFYQVLITKYNNNDVIFYTSVNDANNNVDKYGSYETLNGLVRFRNAVGNEDSGYTQINGSSIVTGSIKAAQIDVDDLTTQITTIGDPTKEHFTISGTALKAYNTNGNQYFSVSADGITYGNSTNQQIVASQSSVFNQLTGTTQTAYSLDVESGATLITINKYYGKSLVFNQLCKMDNSSQSISQYNISWTNNNNGTVTATGIPNTNVVWGANRSDGELKLYANHKYYICGCPSGGSLNTYHVTLWDQTTGYLAYDYGNGVLYTSTADHDNVNVRVRVVTGYDLGSGVVFTPQLFDLTQMFGAGNEPSTVEEFRAMFPAEYYAYNEGEVIHADVDKVVEQGRNLLSVTLPTQTKNGVTLTNNGDGTYTVNGTATAETSFGIYLGDVSGQLNFYGCPSGGNFTLYDIFPWDNTLSARPKATEGSSVSAGADTGSGAKAYFVKGHDNVIRMRIYNGYTANNLVFKPMVTREQSSYSQFVPYHKVEYPISQAIRNLDGYGWSIGNIYNEVDFERKKYIQRVGGVDLGMLDWTYTASAMRFRGTSLSPIAKNITSGINGICDIYTVSNKPWYDSERTDLQIMPKADVVYVRNFAYTDAIEFMFAMDGVMLYYELETPIEIDISDILKSYNVEDGGTITFHNSNGDDYRIPVESKLMWYDSSLESKAKADSENASKTATNYLKYIPQSGLYVTDDTSDLDNAVKIDSDSVDIIKDGETVGQFGVGIINCDAHPEDPLGARMNLDNYEANLMGANIYIIAQREMEINGENLLSLEGSQILANGSPIVSMETLNNIFGTSYSIPISVTNGTFTNNGCSASLVGNILRLYISCDAKNAISAGNITNQTMLTITVNNDKIKSIWSIDTTGGSSGPNAQIHYGVSNNTITVTLAAIAQSIAKGGTINGYVGLPCTLNMDAYFND